MGGEWVNQRVSRERGMADSFLKRDIVCVGWNV